MKKFFLYTLIFISAVTLCSAKNAHLSSNEYEINLEYNDQVNPGDAVFIRMSFENKKGGKRKNLSAKATAEILSEKKSASSAQFFTLSAKKNYSELLAGLPLSSFAREGQYEIKINYSVNGENEKQFELPLTILKKEFESGVIKLTQNMSDISTNTSPEKIEQSKKLNDIINSTNTENVFNLKKFIPPVTSKRRTTTYAERIIYKYPSGKESTNVHNGIDFGKPDPKSNTHMNIVAPADGKVVMAENRIATGWTIIIEHLPGFYSMYYHMTEIKVKVGQMVKQGDLIGLSGSTGFSTGEHLHWELRLNSMIVNPDFFIENNYSFEK